MKCKNCGKEIANDDLFCGYCGTKQENDSIFCSKCGTANEKDSKFCFKCGNDLASEKPVVKKIDPKIIEKPKKEAKPEPKEEVIPEYKEEDLTEMNPVLTEEPKKKSPVVPIIIISVVVLAVVGVVSYFAFFKGGFKSNDTAPKEQTITETDNNKEQDAPKSNEEQKETKPEAATYYYFELEAIDNVRVRSNSTTDSDQVGKIAKGSTIHAYDYRDGNDGLSWYCINDGEWVANDGSFFKVNSVATPNKLDILYGSKGKINVKKDTSIYSSPSLNASTNGWVTESTKLLYYDKISADGKTWLQISCDGFILYDYVEYYYK